ncbi:PstS family phosphate ABC transporter substrate-binding protein [Alkalibacterium putridalgicola]|uniref:Phosphate-binding protein n=1 Tax=Alkalibacterium putridalgicola TaxID=426703 RepID=A0A1H7RJ38_9LACT|nr:PstS family phosphate ABC transporter substrate-binding protein [Alkalibacterium putridalgicola]GEK88863.1 phosphate ABC transporter substrate-binding protein [Alkalibacterium putridalgicola]SEL60018.1 phosphate transport system substrate-binding protein [Alkalibacterium putridalgicola]
MKRTNFVKMGTSLSAVLLLAACGNAPTDEGTGEESAEGSSGSVQVDGSSTVFPIMEGVAEEFSIENPQARATIGVSGTGGGMEKFIAGETDITNASRPMKEEEAQMLEEAGIEYTEFKLALDGLSVVVHPDNDWVDYLTLDELESIWLEESDVETWADVRDGWPDEEILLFSPGTDSGTYDYFDEVILDGEQIDREASLSEDDNILVQGVQGSEHALAYFGYAYYLENQDTVKIVPIENSEGEIVEPTSETVQNGTYEPLSRPLYFYVNNASVQENDTVYEFAKYTLEMAGEMAEEVGYVPLEEAEYEESLETLESLR